MSGGWDLSGWDTYDLGKRTLRRCDPARPVLVDMEKALPPGVGRPPMAHQKIYISAAGLYLRYWMPGRQHGWIQASTSRWWAMVSVDARSSNERSRVTLPLLVAHEHLVLDTPENREKHGIYRPPPWITTQG